LLAEWVGGDRRLAAKFLTQSADRKIEYLSSIEPGDDLSKVTPLAHWYSSLRLAAAKILMEAECAAARTLAESLPRSISGKSKQGRRKTAQPTRG
jgi:hypothetical protein